MELYNTKPTEIQNIEEDDDLINDFDNIYFFAMLLFFIPFLTE